LDINSKIDDSTVCFEHQGIVPTDTIKVGNNCYDSSTAKSTDIQSVCPFLPFDPKYAWVNETYNEKKTPLIASKILHTLNVNLFE
jgi:hypothetical protein